MELSITSINNDNTPIIRASSVLILALITNTKLVNNDNSKKYLDLGNLLINLLKTM